MDQPLFHLTYVMQRDDFIALTRTMLRRTPQRVALEALLLAAIIVGGYFVGAGPNALALPNYPAEFYPALAAAVVLLLAVLFPMRWLQLWLTARSVYRRNAAAGKTITYDIDDTTIVGGIPGVQTALNWSAVTRLIETPERLFIAISRREALIVPRRAFTDVPAYAAFIAFAKSRIRDS